MAYAPVFQALVFGHGIVAAFAEQHSFRQPLPQTNWIVLSYAVYLHVLYNAVAAAAILFFPFSMGFQVKLYYICMYMHVFLFVV